MEILKRGRNLSTILAAGQWRSGAFMHYIAKNEVDQLAMFRLIDEAESNDDDTSGADKKKVNTQASKSHTTGNMSKKTQATMDFFFKPNSSISSSAPEIAD